MNIAFDGIHEIVVTFLATDQVEPGQVVKIADQGTVAPCSAGEAFCGVALSTRQGGAAVQLGGFVTLSCGSGLPALGWVNLVADGQGGVTAGTSGTAALVVSTNEAAQTAVVYL